MNIFRKGVLLLGLVGALVVWFFRDPLRSRIVEKVTLAKEAPSIETMEEIIEKAADPQQAILSAWNTGKTAHREVAIREVSRLIPVSSPISAQMESILTSAALDPDSDVREVALSILENRRHPALAALAAAQFQDCDPQVRLLGLNHLRPVSAAIAVPLIVPLLDDSDPMIVATALKFIENPTGQKFGVKLSETVSVANEETGLEEFHEESLSKAKAGADRARTWWAAHQTEFKPVHLEIPPEALAGAQPLRAADFQLPTLDGRRVHLAQFRGKVVLINFWTTWCSACMSEIPALVALQKRYGDRLVILGVSLDSIPDEEGHIEGHSEAEAHAEGPVRLSRSSLKKIREKIARTMKTRGINYTVLLDEKYSVAGRFNGAELPTTVIVDAEGRVRRRFIGARSLPVFEAMIAEASQAVGSKSK